MIKKTLANGLKVIFQKTRDQSVTIDVTVRVGSNDEVKGIRGISHFIEHMLFEGTKKRPDSKSIAAEIENLGGEFNAATHNERTSYYVKIANKHFLTAVDILSDLIQNSTFEEKMIEKEKKVVLNEIDMVNDEPRFFQWVLFEKALFSKINTRFPAYGNKTDVKKINRSKILEFFSKYYVPNNMVISVVGNIKDPFPLIRKRFTFKRAQNPKKTYYPKEVPKSKTVKVKKSVQQSYFVIGYSTCTAEKKDAIALEIIRAHLGKGFSGTLFEEIRNKRGLAYSLGVVNEPKINFGYFAVYLSSAKKNIPLIKKIILTEIEKIGSMTEENLKNAKSFLAGEFAIHFDDNQRLADQLSFLELVGDAHLHNQFIPVLKTITLNDVIRVKRQYLNKPVIAILEKK